MTLCDKFGLIENHLCDEPLEKNILKITNFFENYLNSDIRILMPDYVNQSVWFNNINVRDFISRSENQIQNYLIQRRNNIRAFIKKDNFEISNLNKFFKTFMDKLEYLDQMLKMTNNEIIKIGLKQLSNLVISDSLIIMFIEEKIILLESSSKHEIESLLEFTKKLHKYDNSYTYNRLLLMINNVFKKHLVNVDEYPLPQNIRNIQKLSDTIDFLENVKSYYSCINGDFNIYGLAICQTICQDFITVIRSNTIEEIEFVFSNSWSILLKNIIENKFEGKNELLLNISKEVIHLIDKILKSNNKMDILSLINLFKYFDQIVENTDYKNIINEKITSSFDSSDFLDQIHTYINEMMYSADTTNIMKLLKFIGNTNNHDIFINKYYQFLIKRLMSMSSAFTQEHDKTFKNYIENEKKISDFLRAKYGNKLCYKIDKVIRDTETSAWDNFDFQHINQQSDGKFSVITTSFNNWDINQDEGIVTNSVTQTIKTTQLGKYMCDYQDFYDLKYLKRRIINWFPHFGEVSMTFLGHDFTLLPIQFMVVELFTEMSCIKMCDLMSLGFFANYSPKFRSDIIGSLVSSGMFKIINDQLVLQSTGPFSTNLIEIFLSTSDYTAIWDQKRENELAHSREDITCTVVNHIVKTLGKMISYDDLYNQSKQSISTFELSNEIFSKSIHTMCANDYIKECEPKHYIKIFY